MLSSILANLQYAFETWKSNPFLWVVLLALAIKYGCQISWHVNPPIHVEGSKVKEIHNQAEWNAAVEEAKQSGAIVVVDFYALWCPPCKRAAPVYAALSKCMYTSLLLYVNYHFMK